MKMLEYVAELIFPLIVSAAAAVAAALITFLAVVDVGATLFSGEASYGVGLGLGPVAALVTGVLAFVFVFRKMRGQ
jgi:hypothetical protein